MLSIEDLKDFKIEKRKIVLPSPEDGKGHLVYLPYLNPEKCTNVIKKMNNLFNRRTYWRSIYRDYMYDYRLFNKRVRYVDQRGRNEILDGYEERDRSIKGIKNLIIAKNRNCFIDLSFYMESYFNFRRYSWKVSIEQFLNLLKLAIFKESLNSFDKRIIVLDLSQWEIDNKDIINKYNILNNPLSIIYLAMRKRLDDLRSLGDVTFLVTDGVRSFFKFNTSTLDKFSYLDFKLAIFKIKPEAINQELDNDKHLDVYGAISSKAPESELDKAKVNNSTDSSSNLAKDTEDEENTNNKSLTDLIKDAKKDNGIEDDTDEDEETEEDIESDEDSNDDEEGKQEESKDESKKEEELEDELLKEIETDEETYDEIEKLVAKEVPNTATSARQKKLIEEQKLIKLESGKTLEEVIDEKKHNPSFTDIKSTNISDKVNTLNHNLVNVTYPNFENTYNKEAFEKDFYSIFNSLSEKKDLPVYIRKVSKEDTSDSLNLKDTYKFELEDAAYGRRHTLTVDVPKFIEGKFMYLGGNKKIFIKQLILKPIVKIAPDTVQICTNYAKVFMYRYGDNVSPKLQNFLRLLSGNSIFKPKRGNAMPLNVNYKTTIEYDVLAKQFLEIKIKNSPFTLVLSQAEIDRIIKENNLENDPNVKAIDRDKSLIIGYSFKNGKYEFHCIPTDESTLTNTGFNNGEDLDPNPDNDEVRTNLIDYILSFVKAANPSFNIDKEYSEIGAKVGKKYIYSRCKIMKKFIPTVILLSYLEGLSEVLRKAKINYTFTEKRPVFKLAEEKLVKGVIQFADGYLVFDRYPIQNSLLMNAFSMIDTKSYTFAEMNQKDAYIDIFGILYDSRILSSAFDSFYDNMIDPITKEILNSMNYPDKFVELFLMGNLLLADNNYTTEIDMNNFRVRSNEMVNAMLYKIIANAYSRYKRTAHNKSPVKITIPPSALIREIVTSQSVEDYSILNPLAEVRKSRAITAKGPSGINLDQAYTEEKRSFDQSMTGLMSVTTSPDGNCGVSRELTAEPKIQSVRGYIDTSIPLDKMGDANLFSMSEMLTPLGVSRDDSIRTAMNAKQSSHLMPAHVMNPVLLSNGAEKVVPYHLSSDFTIIAKHDGVVEDIDENNELMIIRYTYKEGNEVKSYRQVVNYGTQVVKNGAGGFFIPNKLKPYVKLGDKFKANDVIAGDSNFFGNYSDGVKFNIGTLAKVACMGGYNTFEDSTIITTRLSHKMASQVTMEKHLVLGKNANLLKICKIGQKINVNDIIAEYDPSSEDDSINKLLANISDDLKEDVTSMSKNKILSKYTGVVSDIKVYCVSELEELSPSLKAFVTDHWKYVANKKKILKKYSINNPEDTGNLFKIEDKPVKPVNGKVKGFSINEGVLIFIYITYHNPFSCGDKLTNWGPLKGVCSEIIPINREFYSEFRPKEEISTIFPPAGLMARMVPSVLVTMFVNKLLIELKRQLCTVYLGQEYDYRKDFEHHIDGVPDNNRTV